jgi:Trk K+ transport system NAD-binding subunit
MGYMAPTRSASFRTEVKDVGSSSFLILMAKSEIHSPQVWQAVENREYQRTLRRENDFAISIIFGEQGMGLLPAMLGIGSTWTR